MKKDDFVYLHHIKDAIERIEFYISEAPKAHFLKDGMMQDAVIRQLEIIGEASRNISESFQEGHSYIPWGQIIALRNRIIHEYFNINLEVAWDIIKVDIPQLKIQITNLLNKQ